MNKFIFWWDSPCKGMIGVIKYFCENLSPNSQAITGNLGPYRVSMGWNETKSLFANHLIIPKDSLWIEKTLELLEKYSTEYVHVFGGATHGRCSHLVKYAKNNDLRYIIMTEAPFNNKFGLLKIIKNLYINLYLPIITKPIANKSLLVFCLSGQKRKDLALLHKLGYAKNKIIPYGYWTEAHITNVDLEIKEEGKIHILCPGVLRKYKGVDLLVKSIKILVDQGYENFICYITGDGDQYDKLNNLVTKYQLNNYISFKGVLSEDDFKALYNKTDILVAPGYSEPWGIRINEAIQRGKVVICSDGLGASDLVHESGGGTVFKSGDVNGLVSAIQPYLDDQNKLIEAKNANLIFKDKISVENKSKELYYYLKNL